MARVIHMQHRLDGQHGAEQGRRSADPAATLQMVQVVHGEPVAHLRLGLLRKDVDLVDGLPLPLFLDAEVYQQPLAQRGAERVHHKDLPSGVCLPQVIGGDHRRLVGGGERGGKGQVQHVPAAIQNLPHSLIKHAHADGGGGRQGAGAEPGIEVLEADLPAVQVVVVHPVLHIQAQGQHLQLQIRRHPRGHVAAAVCQDHKIIHAQSFSFSFLARSLLLAWAALAASSRASCRWRSSVTYRLLATPAA